MLALLLVWGAGCAGSGPETSPAAPTSVSARHDNVEVQLAPGWNGFGSRSQLFTHLASNPGVAGFATWNGAGYDTASLDLDNLNVGAGGRRGMWVFATRATSFTYSGLDEGSRHVDLSIPGYQLVSFCSSADLPGSSIVARQNGNVVPMGSVVLTQFFELGSQGAPYVPVDVAHGGTLKAGRAYWVFANLAAGPIRLTYPTPSPSPSPTPPHTPVPSVTPAPAPAPDGVARLAFSTSPPASLASGAEFPVTVHVHSAGATFTGAVTLALAASPAGGALGGTLTVNAVNGVATFNGLTANRVGTYVIRATASGVTADTAAFTVTVGPAARLSLVQQPTGGTTTGPIQPYVGVAVLDAQGNPTTSTASLVATATGPAALSGGTPVSAVAGVAGFTDLTLTTAGTYTLTFTSVGLTPVTSASFPIGPAAPSTIAFTNSPGSGTAGVALASTVNVTISPATAGHTITLFILPDGTDSPLGAALNGTGNTSLTATTDATGRAAFTVTPNKSGVYSLRATGAGVAAPATPYTLTVGAGPATALRFIQQPGTNAAALDFVTAIAVEAIDAQGNRVTTATGTVSLSQVAGTGLIFNPTAALSAGVATFTSFQVGGANPAARLRASLAGLPSVDSTAFRVSPELSSRRSDTPTAAGTFLLPALSILSDEGQHISADGRYLIMRSGDVLTPDANGVDQIYRRDRQTGVTELVSSHAGVVAEAGCVACSLSSDGRYAVFSTSATFGGVFDSGGGDQVYYRDMLDGSLKMVSSTTPLGSIGGAANSGGPVVSADGVFVAYRSSATDLPGAATSGSAAQIYRWTASNGSNVLASRVNGGAATAGSAAACDQVGMSDDGNLVVFNTGTGTAQNLMTLSAGATVGQIFRSNLRANTIELVSRRAGGAATEGGNADSDSPSVSYDGARIAYRSLATDVASPNVPTAVRQIYHRDMAGPNSLLISQIAGGSASQGSALACQEPAISGDGGFVAFVNSGTDLVPGVGGSSRSYYRGLGSATVLFGTDRTGAPSYIGSGSRRPSLNFDGGLGAFYAGGLGLSFGVAVKVFVALP